MKIAIIGTGISGAAIAYLLHPQHDITVYEQAHYVGGHTRTLSVATPEGHVPVDTGFIVFNHRNYPNLTQLFKRLGTPIAKSNMSFGVSIDQGWLEYSTMQLPRLFAQPSNLFRPAFYGMLKDILTFNKQILPYLEKYPEATLNQCFTALKLGAWFQRYYFLAMGAAIWSISTQQMLDYPALPLIRFFANHGLLTVSDQPQWYTVEGGSQVYMGQLTSSYRDRIRLNQAVTKVERVDGGVNVHTPDGQVERYDQVVLACHSDQALAMLSQPTANEQHILGAIRYQPNRVVLHRDKSFMPQRKAAWASWVYLSDQPQDQSPCVSLSYWMNNLQPLNTSTDIFVTLNPGREPASDLVENIHEFSHPIFDLLAIKAQQDIDTIQGQDKIWYCGAWQSYGFHEDGLVSAVKVAQKMGVTIPW